MKRKVKACCGMVIPVLKEGGFLSNLFGEKPKDKESMKYWVFIRTDENDKATFEYYDFQTAEKKFYQLLKDKTITWQEIVGKDKMWSKIYSESQSKDWDLDKKHKIVEMEFGLGNDYVFKNYEKGNREGSYYEAGGILGEYYDLRFPLGYAGTKADAMDNAINSAFYNNKGKLDKNRMDKTIKALSKKDKLWQKQFNNYKKVMEVEEENGKYINPFTVAHFSEYKHGGEVDNKLRKLFDALKIKFGVEEMCFNYLDNSVKFKPKPKHQFTRLELIELSLFIKKYASVGSYPLGDKIDLKSLAIMADEIVMTLKNNIVPYKHGGIINFNIFNKKISLQELFAF